MSTFRTKRKRSLLSESKRFLTNEARSPEEIAGQTTLEEQRQAVGRIMVEQVVDKSYTSSGTGV